LCRDARLIERGGLDEIADCLGARQINAAIEVGSQREFAGFREACACFHGSVETVAKNYRGTMAGNLDDVFGGVGFRRREVGNDGLVDDLNVVMIGQLRAGRRPGFEFTMEVKNGGRDLRCLRT
jgi:hypothetical protein